MPKLTQRTVMTMPNEELIPLLRKAAANEDRRYGAVLALTAYNGGSLVGYRAIRERIVISGDLPYIEWAKLRDLIEQADKDQVMPITGLNSSALATFRFAVALATDSGHNGGALHGTSLWGLVNRKYMIVAFAAAMGEATEEDIDDEYEANAFRRLMNLTGYLLEHFDGAVVDAIDTAKQHLDRLRALLEAGSTPDRVELLARRMYAHAAAVYEKEELSVDDYMRAWDATESKRRYIDRDDWRARARVALGDIGPALMMVRDEVHTALAADPGD